MTVRLRCPNQFPEIYETETTDLNQFASTLTVVVNQTDQLDVNFC